MSNFVNSCPINHIGNMVNIPASYIKEARDFLPDAEDESLVEIVAEAFYRDDIGGAQVSAFICPKNHGNNMVYVAFGDGGAA